MLRWVLGLVVSCGFKATDGGWGGVGGSYIGSDGSVVLDGLMCLGWWLGEDSNTMYNYAQLN